jgi:hypothetical protein
VPENIRQQSLNSRRGLLLGMTLAEVMLIILFALLLLLGRQFIDLEEAKETLQNYATVISAGWSQNMSEKEVEALTGLIEETKKRQKPDEEISKTWETLTSNLEEDRNKPDEESDASELLSRLEDAKIEAEKAKEKQKEAEKVADAAQEELRKAKAGSPPPCIFEPGLGGKIRGSSVALGSIYLNEQGISLIDVNREIPSIGTVDFLGRKAEYDMEAYRLISSWPEDKILSFNEFGQLAQSIKEIGNRETDTKLKCLFTMYYYDEIGTSVDTFTDQFERYFLKQRKLEQDELENFRRN